MTTTTDDERKPAMSADEFRVWMVLMGWSINRSARGLGIGRNTIIRYKTKGAPQNVAEATARLAEERATIGDRGDRRGT